MNDNQTSSYYDAPAPEGQPFVPDPRPPSRKKMSKGKKWGIGIGAVLAIGLIGSLGNRTPTVEPATAPSPVIAASTAPSEDNSPTVDPSVQASLDKAAADKAAADKAAADKAAADKAAADKAAADKAAADKAAADKAAAEKAANAMTKSQEQAIAKAQEYLAFSAFSRKGLIEQLRYEKFSKADATFAVDHIKVDWMAQAAAKAKEYLDYSSFSRGGLIEQLEFEGFTHAQATHGANAVGL